MAFFRRSPNARSLTAAGRKLDPQDEQTIKSARRGPDKWQERAYGYRDLLGELRFASNYYANAMSRIRLVPAIESLDADRAAIPIDQAAEDPEQNIDPETAALVQQAADRLGGTPLGQSELLSAAAENVFLGGEVYVIGRAEDDREVWSGVARSAISSDPSGRALALLEEPDQPRDKQPSLADAIVFRVWRKHPQYVGWADSPVRGALEYCEDLRTLTMMIRASAWSRIPSHVLGIPTEASFAESQQSGDPGDTEGEASTGDKLSDDIIAHFSTPKSDPSSAAALVPFLLRLPGEQLAQVQKWEFNREIDRLAVDLRRETRESLAGSIDLPVDVLTGKQGLNHWSSWEVTEETFRMHLEPMATLLCAGFTEGYFVPMLNEMGVEDASRFMLWYDPSALISHPNRGRDYGEAYDRGEVKGEAYTRELGIPDEDRADEAELARRANVVVAIGGSNGNGSGPAEAEDVTPGPPDTTPSGTEAAHNGNGSLDHDAVEAIVTRRLRLELPTILGATRPINLGHRLGDMERSLTAQVREMAEASLRRALERAGNRLRSIAAKSPEARQVVAGCDPMEVGARLGPNLTAALDTSATDLFVGAFDDLESRVKAAMRRRHDEAIRLIRRRGMTAAGSLSESDTDEFQLRQEEDRDEAWALLLLALGGAAATRLFTPTIEPPSRGEFAETLLPAADLRAVMTAAGGGPSIGRTSTGLPVEVHGGALSGATIVDIFERAVGLTLGGYEWVYGDPGSRTTPFDQHLDLDGEQFATWDDPILQNVDDWPDAEFLHPGDHPYCQCTFQRVVLEDTTEQDEADEAALAEEDAAAAATADVG